MNPALTAQRAVAAAVLVGSVAWGGATRAPATLVLAALSALALGSAVVEARRWERPLLLAPAALPLLALTALTMAQLVPLPPALRMWLSPVEEQTRALVLDGVAHAAWRPLTADVAATVHQAARLAGLSALAIALGRLGSEAQRDFLRQALLAALAGLLLLSGLGAAGVPLPPPLLQVGSVRGFLRFPFANPNHAGAYLALCLPIVVALVARRRGREQAIAAVLLAAGNVALASTASRGAIAVGLGAQALTLALIARSSQRGARRLVLGVGAALAVGAAIAVPLLVARLLSTGEGIRLALWRHALALVRDHLAVGAGRGAVPFVITRYSPMAARLRFAFVENEYLQVLCDVGVVGALVLAAAMIRPLARLGRAWPGASLGARAAVVGLIALALHNVADFSVEGGAVAAAACAAAAIGFGAVGARVPLAAAAALGAIALALVALALSPVGRTAEEEAAYLAEVPVGTDTAGFEARARAALSRHPSDAFLCDVAAERLLDAGDLRAAAWLERALLLSPHDPHAHRLAARALARAGLGQAAAIELAESMREANDTDREAAYAEALRLFPRDEDAPNLVRAIPPSSGYFHVILSRLMARQRWRLALPVAEAALAVDQDDAQALAWAIECALHLGDDTQLEARARRLAARDPRASSQLLAAQALAHLGREEEADKLLDAALADAQGEELVSLASARVERAIARKDLPHATEIAEHALARAIESGDKARLHLLRARVEDLAGHPHRAELERSEAARLAGH